MTFKKSCHCLLPSFLHSFHSFILSLILLAYLNEHKYKNAVTNDLWRALSAASGKDVSAFMNRWVTHVGYPVVSVRRANESDANDDGDTFVVEQERFLANGRTVDEGDGVWWLSLKLAAAGGWSATVESQARSQRIKLDRHLTRSAWVKFNAGQSGLFRVRYSAPLLDGLALAVKSRELPAIDRLAIQVLI